MKSFEKFDDELRLEKPTMSKIIGGRTVTRSSIAWPDGGILHDKSVTRNNGSTRHKTWYTPPQQSYYEAYSDDYVDNYGDEGYFTGGGIQ